MSPQKKKPERPKLPTRPPSGGRKPSLLVAETEMIERARRIEEQRGELQFGSVKARDHSNKERNSAGLEGGLQNDMPQHPALDKQYYDGTDSSLNPDPPLNTDARREFDNEKREQQKEYQLTNMPKFNPKPSGP